MILQSKLGKSPQGIFQHQFLIPESLDQVFWGFTASRKRSAMSRSLKCRKNGFETWDKYPYNWKIIDFWGYDMVYNGICNHQYDILIYFVFLKMGDEPLNSNSKWENYDHPVVFGVPDFQTIPIIIFSNPNMLNPNNRVDGG
jgi:hypothetical protein